MSALVGIDRDDDQEEPERPVRYHIKPAGKYCLIQPVKPPKGGEMAKTAGDVKLYVAGGAPKRKKEETQDHLDFKQTHARVLAIGPEVTKAKVGDIIRFVGHPTTSTVEPVQEFWANGDYQDCLHEDLIYCILVPVDEPSKVLQ